MRPAIAMCACDATRLALKASMGDRMYRARRETGLNREEFAAELDISRNSVGNYESGRTRPIPVILKAWAFRCRVSYDWLLTGETPPQGVDAEPAQ